MKILVLSKEGDGLGIAQRLQQEENDVSLFIQSKKFIRAGRGIVERVPSWRPLLRKVDLVIADMVGFGYLEPTIKASGKPYLGLSKLGERAELDRAKGIELLERAEILIPTTYHFSSPTEALQVLDFWADPGFVIKPSGNMATALTQVCRDEETFRWALTRYPAGTQLIVQELIEGIEVSTEGWFNGRDWLEPFNHTFEEKRFFPGDLGPNTGCMGNIVVAAQGTDNLIKETVLKLEPFLRKITYRGPIDINCIVTETAAYALEVTARFGYDAIEALMEGLLEPVTDVLHHTALGVKTSMNLAEEYLASVRVSVPPYPYADPKDVDIGIPILGINDQNLSHLFLTDVDKTKNGSYRYSASDGVVYKATAHGRSVKEVRDRVYRTVDNVTVQDMQYRDDIGQRVNRNMTTLASWGWI